MSNVIPIGCPTHHWQRAIIVDAAVQRKINADPSLSPLLRRKLKEHGQRLPKILGRDTMFHTCVWKSLGPKACFITTYCSEEVRIVTSVHLVKKVFQ